LYWQIYIEVDGYWVEGGIVKKQYSLSDIQEVIFNIQ